MSPSVYIIAGPNGAGKTTFAREFLPNYADCKNFINADLIAQGVSPFSPEAAAFRAGRLMLEEIDLYANRGESFGFETTLSGRSHLRLIRNLKKRGYELHIFFLWVPTVDLALTRVRLESRKAVTACPKPWFVGDLTVRFAISCSIIARLVIPGRCLITLVQRRLSLPLRNKVASV